MNINIIKISLVTLLLAIILAPKCIHAQLDYDIVPSFGIPSGYLDYSANLFLYLDFPEKYNFIPRLAFQESYSHKKDFIKDLEYINTIEGGKIYTNNVTFYALALKKTQLLNTFLYPNISGGLGFHIIHSWIKDRRYTGNTNNTSFTTKLHAFVGLDIKTKAPFYIFIKARATVPSDIIFDSVYFGIGLFP